MPNATREKTDEAYRECDKYNLAFAIGVSQAIG
jgi:hypothetical protein